MSERFDFDAFDERCRVTIESAEHAEADAKLCLEGIALTLVPDWVEPDLHDIGPDGRPAA